MTDHDHTADAAPTGAPAQPATCSRKQEQRGLPIAVARMMGLETAADMLGGKAHLAAAIGIGLRALNYKLSAERGVSNVDLIFAAKALDEKARHLVAHAQKLRDVAQQQDVAR